jgi:hypothetical protein
VKLKNLRALYIKNSVGYTPKGAGKKSFLSDYQKRKPPVKKEVAENNQTQTGGPYERGRCYQD